MKRLKFLILPLLLVNLMILPELLPTDAYVQKAEAATSKMNKRKLTLSVGDTFTLTIRDASKVTWKSSDKAVATVSSKGKVTAVNKGTTTITASVGGRSYKCAVTVNGINPYLDKAEYKVQEVMIGNVSVVAPSDWAVKKENLEENYYVANFTSIFDYPTITVSTFKNNEKALDYDAVKAIHTNDTAESIEFNEYSLMVDLRVRVSDLTYSDYDTPYGTACKMNFRTTSKDTGATATCTRYFLYIDNYYIYAQINGSSAEQEQKVEFMLDSVMVKQP